MIDIVSIDPQSALDYNGAYEWPPRRDRPTGVTILALFIGGLNALLGCLTLFALSALGGYAILVLFALNVWVAVGLWRMRGWARTAAMVLYGVNVAFALISAFANGLTVEGVVTFVVALVIIYYLTRLHVAEAFE